ncbi:Uncharacterised protein [Raoultella planticola]|nr:Uncharacterised protein [Raoultella planticola]
MERIRPLIGSVDAPDHRQPWRTGGLWRRTINLYVEGGALLTLHHRGQGVSPRRMGRSPSRFYPATHGAADGGVADSAG